ncbi:MAG: hypothetical protein R6W69_05175, partial [Anaerolineales bacterium]
MHSNKGDMLSESLPWAVIPTFGGGRGIGDDSTSQVESQQDCQGNLPAIPAEGRIPRNSSFSRTIRMVIPLPALDGLIQPGDAVALRVFLAFKRNQAFSSSPVTTDFGQQVVEQPGLVDG